MHVQLSSLHSYEYSKNATWEACRKMIKCYQTLRSYSRAAPFVCDLMDYQVFTAAVVLVISLLSQTQQLSSYREDDWELIHAVTASLKSTSEHMKCTVASQASHLLKQLYSFRQGNYTSPELYEAVIPLFGKVRIVRPACTSQINLPITVDQQLQQVSQLGHIVEFGTNYFAPFTGGVAGDLLAEPELGINWSANAGLY